MKARAEKLHYLTVIEDYTLEVTPKEVTVTTASDAKEYDGTPLTAAGANITGLVNNETATVTATGSQIDAGKGNYTGTINRSFTIEKANPTVRSVSVTDPATVYDTSAIGDVVMGFTSVQPAAA